MCSSDLTPGIYGPVIFNDDYTLGNDSSNSYGSTTPQGTPVTAILSIYTAPTAGNYSFTSQLSALTTFTQQNPSLSVFFRKFDASNNIIDDFEGPKFLMQNNGYTVASATWNTYMNVGEYVAVYFNTDYGYWSLDIEPSYQANRPLRSYFTSNGVNNANGIVLASNPNNYKCFKVNIKYPIKLSDFKAIGNSKNGLISIPLHNNRSIRG